MILWHDDDDDDDDKMYIICVDMHTALSLDVFF